jgi:hypothetical protein
MRWLWQAYSLGLTCDKLLQHSWENNNLSSQGGEYVQQSQLVEILER